MTICDRGVHIFLFLVFYVSRSFVSSASVCLGQDSLAKETVFLNKRSTNGPNRMDDPLETHIVH